MATQIAATPIIRGSQAKKIYQEAHKKPSDKAKLGAEKFVKEFSIRPMIIIMKCNLKFKSLQKSICLWWMPFAV